MLCMQQCIDLCDLAPEEADAIRQHASLAEILAIQAECPRCQRDAAADDADDAATCGMLDLRDRMLESDLAADDFDDLEDIVHDYCGHGDAGDADRAVGG